MPSFPCIDLSARVLHMISRRQCLGSRDSKFLASAVQATKQEEKKRDILLLLLSTFSKPAI
jgi:hypothetical protein